MASCLIDSDLMTSERSSARRREELSPSADGSSADAEFFASGVNARVGCLNGALLLTYIDFGSEALPAVFACEILF